MVKSPGLRKMQRRMVTFLIIVMAFVSACITSIESITIDGLFQDAAGTVPMPADDVHGLLHVGYTVQFSYNPNFFEDNPPHPEDRLDVYFVFLDANQNRFDSHSPIDTTLLTDGDYQLEGRVSPTGGFDTGFAVSGFQPITIKNAGRQNQPPTLGRRPPMNHPGPQNPAQNSPAVGDDINPRTGELTINSDDLSVTSRGMPISFTRTYRSQLDYNGPLGHGWNFIYNQLLVSQPDGSVTLADGCGYIIQFTPDGSGGFQAPSGIYLVLSRNADASYTVRERGGTRRDFLANGLLSSIVDRNDNRISMEYDSAFNLTTIRDCIGRPFTLAYSFDGLLQSITDFTGRVVRYGYDGDANLIEVTLPPSPAFPAGRTTRYTYSAGQSDAGLNHDLLTITDPNGQTFLDSTYDALDRVVTQRFNSGTFRLEYQEPLIRTTVTDREDNQTTHVFDSTGHTTSLTQVTRGLRASDPPSYTTTMRYNAHGELVEQVRPRGNIASYLYDDQNPDRLSQKNLLEERRKAGTAGTGSDLVTTYTYEPRFQRIKAITPPRGNDPAEGPPARFQSTFFYDYEEGSDLLATDLNGDGDTSQKHGNVVKAVFPSTTIPDGNGLPAGTNVVAMKYSYDEHGLLLTQTLPTGTRNRFDYFPSTGLPDDPSSREGYASRLVRDVDGLAATVAFERDARGNVTAVTDPNGRTTAFEYSPSDRIIRTISSAPFNYERTVTYDGNDDPLELVQQNLRGTLSVPVSPDPDLPTLRTQLTYTLGRKIASAGQTITSTRTATIRFEYDRSDRIVRMTSAMGRKTAFAYDERDLTLRRTQGEGSSEASTVHYSYNPNGLLEATIDPRGHVWRITHDAFDRIFEAVDPEGAAVRITRNADGMATRTRAFDTTTRGGAVLTEILRQYDELGQLTFTDQPIFGAGVASGSSRRTMQRDAGGRLVRSLNANQHETRLEYDGLDRTTKVRDAIGNEIQLAYDPAGNVVEQLTRSLDPARSTVEAFRVATAYDELNRVVTTVNNAGFSRRLAYDSRSNVVMSSDANGAITGNGNGTGNTRRWSYDGLGRVTRRFVDQRQGGTGAGDIIGVIQTSMSWDDDSRLTTVRDDNGAETQYAYDGLQRLRSIQLADGSAQSITYDTAGNPLQVLQPNGTSISNQFSPTNRLSARQIARAVAIRGEVSESYQYDGLGRCVSMASDVSQVQFAFDSLSRIVQEVQDGKTVGSTFDPAGNRLSLKYPGGRTVRASFDALERTVQLKDAADSSALASFAYIGDNRLGSSRYQNNTAMRVLYDQVPRPETIINSVEYEEGRRKKTEVFGGFQYIYDREGNQKAEIRIRGDSKGSDGFRLGDGDLYRYDSAYRLTKATFDVDRPLLALMNPSTSSSDGQVTYNLDGVDNWLSTIRTEERGSHHERNDHRAEGSHHGRTDHRAEVTNYTVNELNQVTAANNHQIIYDRNGSRVNDSKFRYVYNYRGQLVQATRRLSRSRSLDVHFRYDPLGRRISRTMGVSAPQHHHKGKGPSEDDDDDGGDDPPLSKVGATRFYYDGQRVIEEQDHRGRTLRTFVHGSGLSSPLSMDVASDDPDCDWWDDDDHRGRKDAPKRFFFHRNVLGSISHATDKKGRVVESYSYDAYGVPALRELDDRCGHRALSCRGNFVSRIGNPYLFAGQRFDPTLGLYDMRARDYDPALGRFLQRDPIGQFGGINLYAYCFGNPVNLADPLGLSPSSFWSDLWDTTTSLLSGAAEGAAEFLIGAIKGALGAAAMAGLIALTTLESPFIAVGATVAAVGLTAYGLYSTGVSLYEIVTGRSADTGHPLTTQERVNKTMGLAGGVFGGGLVSRFVPAGTGTGTNPLLPPGGATPAALPGGGGAGNPGLPVPTGGTLPVPITPGSTLPSPFFVPIAMIGGGGVIGTGGGSGSGGSLPALPTFVNGGRTSGFLVTTDGQVIPLQSGGANPAYSNYIPASHVEGAAAIYMRENGITSAVVYINNTGGICGYCNSMLPTLLAPGSTLEVIPPDGTVATKRGWVADPTIYVGSGNEPKPPK